MDQNKVKPDSFEILIAKLGEIRASLVKLESDFPKLLSSVHPAWRKSADNLLHYLALRHHDIRLLQEELAVLGLSSLGRSESHVMSTLDAVLNVLHNLAGRPLEPPARTEFTGFDEGNALLAANTEALLGPAPTHRGVRIMVTMSTEAADDYTLVHDLVSHGMNCMRINCAHDTPEIWARMVGHLERARRELALPCRILMDLGGAQAQDRACGTGAASDRVASQARPPWARRESGANLACSHGNSWRDAGGRGRPVAGSSRMAGDAPAGRQNPL